MPPRNLAEGAILEVPTVGRGIEAKVVRDKGVHPINGDELLRYGVGYPEVVFSRARYPANHLTPADSFEKLVYSLHREALPVGPHGDP
jgi:hypothetical protein